MPVLPLQSNQIYLAQSRQPWSLFNWPYIGNHVWWWAEQFCVHWPKFTCINLEINIIPWLLKTYSREFEGWTNKLKVWDLNTHLPKIIHLPPPKNRTKKTELNVTTSAIFLLNDYHAKFFYFSEVTLSIQELCFFGLVKYTESYLKAWMYRSTIYPLW